MQEIGELVETIQRESKIEVAILRLLEVDDTELPELKVRYLAQTGETDAGNLPLIPWTGNIDDQALRMAYAKPGGPDRELAWAAQALRDADLGEVIARQQIRTWNLSSIWRLETDSGFFWLKSVPSFFAHELAALALFANEPVPDLVESTGQTMLMKSVPGEDCYDADLNQMLYMIDVLVDLQWRWKDRQDELLAIGLPDARLTKLVEPIRRVVEMYLPELEEEQRVTLTDFVATLDERISKIEQCGIPETLVHGDYHPGNWRGSDLDLTILDWGDCCVGHPLTDIPALYERVADEADRARIVSGWSEAWQAKLPDAKIETAIKLITPIANARMAVVFVHFLENIEPSERIYHETDPLLFLQKTAKSLDVENGAGDEIRARDS
jgi:hypothetical protein